MIRWRTRSSIRTEAARTSRRAGCAPSTRGRSRRTRYARCAPFSSRQPSRGLRLLREWRMVETVAPELVPLSETPQDPQWHPEGDVWTHTLLAVDQAAMLVGDLDRPRALTVMLATLCHDLGKASTTRFERGRVRSPGHEEAGLAPTESLLDRWRVHTLLGYDVRSQVLALVGNHLKPGQLYDDRDKVSDGAIRRLARKCEPLLLYVVALGVEPGPEVGRVVRAVYERQLDGAVTTVEEAREEARRLLGTSAPRTAS
jgi:tRNA nucleotidyltransferase (CCA-adding enzyme)